MLPGERSAILPVVLVGFRQLTNTLIPCVLSDKAVQNARVCACVRAHV